MANKKNQEEVTETKEIVPETENAETTDAPVVEENKQEADAEVANAEEQESAEEENSEVTADSEERMKKMQEEMKDEEDPVVDDGLEDVTPTEIEAAIANAVKNVVEGLTFDRRRVHMVKNKETKRELYAEQERIIDFKGRTAKTDAEKRWEDVAALRDAARSVPPKIMTGQIGGMEVTENGYVMVQVMAKGLNGDIEIKIPASHLFAFNDKDYAGEQGMEYLQNEIQSRIGSEIYFVVFDVREEMGVAFASRLAAMELQGRMNYIKLRGDNIPRYFEGGITEAKVISVRKDRVRVEVGGIETTIKSGRDLSWTALMDCRDEFHIGDKFMVKLLKIGVEEHVVGDKKFNLVKIKVSKTAAEIDPKKKYFHQFKEGAIVSGIIKTEASDMGVFVTVQNKMDVLCTTPSVGKAVPGKACTVRIMKKDEDKKQLSGRILSISR